MIALDKIGLEHDAAAAIGAYIRHKHHNDGKTWSA